MKQSNKAFALEAFVCVCVWFANTFHTHVPHHKQTTLWCDDDDGGALCSALDIYKEEGGVYGCSVLYTFMWQLKIYNNNSAGII